MNWRTNSDSEESLTLVVSEDAQHVRADRWLAQNLPDHSRSQIQRWLKEGSVTIQGAPVKASHRLATGERVNILFPSSPAEAPYQAEAIDLAIVYEDADLLVVDKPAGMVVHPAPGHQAGTLVNAILYRCPEIGGGGERRPGIVHRLDRDTSGLILVAKHDRALRYLQAQFQQRSVYKEYLALVEGKLEPSQGRISAPIGRHPIHRKRQAVLPPDPLTGRTQGREAITDYRVLSVLAAPTSGSNAVGHFSYVRIVLHTGRTHQIRVHMAWLKHPVVADTVYGYRRPSLGLSRQFLHAHRLRLRLVGQDEEIEFVAPLPADLEGVLTAIGA